MLEGNMQDFTSNLYKARHIGDNEILIEMPAVTSSYLKNFEKFFAEKKRVGSLCKRQQVGHNIARNLIKADKARQIKRLLLRFPPHIVLSRQYLSKNPSMSEELNCDFVRFEDTVTLLDMKCETWVCMVIWKVGVIEFKDRNVEDDTSIDTSMDNGIAKFTEFMKSMHLS